MYSHHLLVKLGLKTCAKCLDDWPIEAFGFDRSRPDGRAVYCKECRKDDHQRKKVLPSSPHNPRRMAANRPLS